MAKEEIVIELDELETRIDRLRALYEQYFIGIEKTEPHVQKRDVERRINNLRKVQFRNTALRFRFQMLVQRYTTYLTYWQRIGRRIEEGTFSREGARRARYGSNSVARKSEEHVYELDSDAIEEYEDFSALTEELSAAISTPTPPVAPPVTPPAAAPAPPPSPPKLPPGVTSGNHATAVVPVANVAEIAVPKPPTVSAPAPTPTLVSTTREPEPVVQAPATVTATVTVPTPAATNTTVQPIAPAKRVGISPFGLARPKGPVGNAVANSAIKPPVVNAKTAAVKPSEPSGVAPVAVNKIAPAAPSTPVNKPAENPSGDGTIQKLFERYRDARQKNGEGEITYETVARQVGDTLPKLSKQYPDHDISFDVANKDGRTVLRPVVRPKGK